LELFLAHVKAEKTSKERMAIQTKADVKEKSIARANKTITQC